MAGLTPFGIEIRKLRLDKKLRLMDLAARMEVSAAYISAVETGRKQIPDAYVVQIARAMNLSAIDIRALRRAADRTRKEIPVEKLSEEQRELVAAFARKLDQVPTAMKEALKKIVFKSSGNDSPFKRKQHGILVPPLSASVIREYAEKVRSAFVEDDEILFPIMDILEFRLGGLFEGFYLDVQDEEVMGEEEGKVIAGQNAIALRTDVYLGAWLGRGRDRFTASHELAHFLMHGDITMARTRGDDDKIYCDSEWQADTFAGTLLMSPRHLSIFKNAVDAAQACGMTQFAAEVMWSKYKSEGKIK